MVYTPTNKSPWSRVGVAERGLLPGSRGAKGKKTIRQSDLISTHLVTPIDPGLGKHLV